MKVNRTIAILLILSLLTALLCACSTPSTGSGDESMASSSTLSNNGNSSAESSIQDISSTSSEEVVSSSQGESSNSSTVQPPEIKQDIIAVTYPDRVQTVEELGYTASSYAELGAGRSASYTGNAGFKNGLLSIVVSPYYTMTVNDAVVPVYATLSCGDGSGLLHSYAVIEVKKSGFPLDVHVQANALSLEKVTALPAYLGVAPSLEGSSGYQATITETGSYTFLVNNFRGEISQQYALTLFVRDYVDEEAEIAAYKNKYGSDQVKVYEAGVHEFDHLQMTSDSSIIYLRRGALLVAKHTMDISSDSDNQTKSEPGASSSNGWGLNRYPVLTAHQKKDVKLVGSGAIDAGALDWHERRGIMFSSCTNVEISGIILTNFPEWTIITYNCTNVNIHDVAVFGWKTNSDAFAICNTRNAEIDNCYAHSGDDLFEVKTLGGAQMTDNVTFTNCVAWNGKARCFGLTSETEKDVSNVKFKRCGVIWRDATWDNSILGSLVVIVSGPGKVSDIVFEDIEIQQDKGRAINVTLDTTNATSVSNIQFKNIRYQSSLPNRISTEKAAAGKADVLFSNITGNGVRLTSDNAGETIETAGKNVQYTVE